MPNKNITAKDVVTKLIDCFYQAHCQSEEFQQDDEKVSVDYCRSIVKKAFEETGGGIDQPTKQSILKAMEYLKTFSLNFRNPKIVNQHFNQILQLTEKINEKTN